MDLREVTQEEITAARLERMAKDLFREAEALRAMVRKPQQSSKHPRVLHEEFRQLASELKKSHRKVVKR